MWVCAFIMSLSRPLMPIIPYLSMSLIPHQHNNNNGDHPIQYQTAMTTIKTKSHQCLQALQGPNYSNHHQPNNKPPSRNQVPITRIQQYQPPPWGGATHKVLRSTPMLPRRRRRAIMAAFGTLKLELLTPHPRVFMLPHPPYPTLPRLPLMLHRLS